MSRSERSRRRAPSTRRPAAWRAASPFLLLGGLALLGVLGLTAPPAGAATARPLPAELTGPAPRVDAAARAEAASHGGEARIEGRLLVHPDDRTGPAVRLGLLLDLDPGWHVYWRTPGDVGLPTEVDWDVLGAEVEPLRWPFPQRFENPELDSVSYGYSERVLLPTVARFADPDAPRPFAAAQVDLLICEYECVPARFVLERSLDGPVEDAERVRALFEGFERRIPVAPAELGVELAGHYTQSAIRPGDEFAGALEVRSCLDGAAACTGWRPVAGDAFFPELPDTVRLRPGRAERVSENRALLAFSGAADAEEPLPEARLRGALALERSDGRRGFVEVDLPFPTARAGSDVVLLGTHWRDAPAPAGPAPAGGGGLLRALLLALLGGLILNAMPCVLPVLAIKVFSVAESAHAERGAVLAQGAAYAGGILASMGALAAVVVGLRSAGHSVGWGFQFQEPLFVAGICIVVLTFALNLFDVFAIELQTGALASVGQEGSHTRRSFFEGLLAVVLATPCSAPFLGTAVGFAFAQDAGAIFAIFACIGLGLAAPFVLVTLVPAWSRWIPRSGTWMLKLRTGLGFALLGTGVWLLWVFGRSAGVDAMAQLMAVLVLLGFGLWVLGSLQGRVRPRASLLVVAALLALVVAGLGQVRTAAAVRAGGDAAMPSDGYAAYDEGAIRAELAGGRAVFVRFTADWCITCKVNERVVLDQEPVRDAIARLDVATFEADWTRRDEKIRSVLQRHGKAGVPMYLVFDPRSPERPRVLSELLTVEGLIGELERAAADQGVRTARRDPPSGG